MSYMNLTFNFPTSGITVQLGLYGPSMSIFDVNWGDGTVDTNLSHTYTTSGSKNVLISAADITTFNNTGAPLPGFNYLTGATIQNGLGMTNLSYAFAGCINLTLVEGLPTDTMQNLSHACDGCTSLQNASLFNGPTVTDMSYLFKNASKLIGHGFQSWNVSNVTNMEGMFYGATTFNVGNIEDPNMSLNLSSWNVSNVTNMSYMFYGATGFNKSVSGWNVSAVTNMRNMFDGAVSFNQSVNWTTIGLLTTMEYMFHNAYAFNNSLGSFNIANVANMSHMLDNCGMDRVSYDATLNGWAAQILIVQNNVTLGASGLYYSSSGSASRTALINTSTPGWTISGDAFAPYGDPLQLKFVLPSNGIFVRLGLTGTSISITNVEWGDGTVDTNLSHTYSLAGTYDISVNAVGATNFNGSNNQQGFQYLTECNSFGEIDLSDYNRAFVQASSLTKVPSSLPLYSNATIFDFMFFVARTFNQNINSWDVSRVRSMEKMFWEANAFNQPLDNWVVSNVTMMHGMFKRATSFNQNINTWDVSRVIRFDEMFSGATAFNQPLSNWNTVSSENIGAMFQGATSFNQNINTWNVSNVYYMPQTFQDATSYNQPLGNWNVSNSRSFSSMFQGATSFNLSINSWTFATAGGITLSSMFRNATAFNQPLNNWNTIRISDMNNMFKSATAFNQNIGSWNVSNVTNMSSMLDNSGINYVNYDATLNGWAGQIPNIRSNITLGAQGMIYSQYGSEARSSLRSSPYNWTILGDTFQEAPIPPCFKEGTKILTNKGYKLIENLRVGDLIKTFKNDYVPVNMIGKKLMQHYAVKERVKEQLYKCSNNAYSEVWEDLIITGCHSILVDGFVSNEQRDRTIEVNGDTYVTDVKYRLPVCADERASVYEIPGEYMIYHLALDNDDYFMNYGIYANGLLVESCSKRYLCELSEMELIK